MPIPRRSGGTTACAEESVRPSTRMVPASGVEETGDHPEERRLAAAARAEQGQELAVPDLEAQLAHGGDGAVPLRHALDRDAGHASAPLS